MTKVNITSPMHPLVDAIVVGDAIIIRAADDWKATYDADDICRLVALTEHAVNPSEDLIEFFDDEFGAWSRRVASFFMHEVVNIEAALC